MADRGDYSQLISSSLTYRGVPSRAFPEGKTYEVPLPDIPTGMRLVSIGEVAQLSNGGVTVTPDDLVKLGLDKLDDGDLERMVLGPAYDEMIADGVPWPAFRAVFTDAFTYSALSPELADALRTRLGEAAAPGDETPSPKPTRQAKAGSGSRKASTGTRGRTRSQGSTRSSKSTRASSSGPTAQAV